MSGDLNLERRYRRVLRLLPGHGSIDTVSGIIRGMAFTLRTDSIAGLDDWLEAEAKAQQTSKQAITIAALQEYRERRDLGHVLALGAGAAARHRAVLDRLADA